MNIGIIASFTQMLEPYRYLSREDDTNLCRFRLTDKVYGRPCLQRSLFLIFYTLELSLIKETKVSFYIMASWDVFKE